jgi:DNA polymerase
MIIGEAPGRKEDELGIPFVGKSGALLTKILFELGIARENVFITNIVKCRPPNNRKPFPIEIKTCTELLLFNQIKIIQPQAICTLGSTAIEGLLKTKLKISAIHGTLFYFDSIATIPTYHPAYIARNPKMVPFFIKDIEKALTLSQKK